MGAIYFTWRLTTFNPDALLLSYALYSAELFGLVSLLLHGFMTWQTVERKLPPPQEGATADIFVTTYNEPVEMLRRTLIAARDINHSHETYLLDDGNRVEMEELAEELGVHYLTRDNNEHAKAGNLNNALKYSTGEFVAIFDSDHVPHKDFLVKTLGFFRDEKVGFVQTPQEFYNLDSIQHRFDKSSRLLWSEQSLFFQVIMPGKEYWNASFFCGSCAIARRSAIEDIGGFATETITEDLHTSMRLHKKGYRSVYHGEPLAFGLAPQTFEPYSSQRLRWGQGAMQVWRLEGMLTARGLTVAQRLCYLASVLTYFDGWQKLFMFLVPSFVLVTGMLPVAAFDLQFAVMFLPWFLLSLWACEELGRGCARSWMIEQYNFLRAPVFVLATLTLFLNRKLRFNVTKKGLSTAALNYRLAATHFTVFVVTVAAVLVGTIRYALVGHFDFATLIVNLFWAGIVIAISAKALATIIDRAKQDRDNYRFRIPLPVRITDMEGKEYLLPARNISSGGCAVRIPAEMAVAVGQVIPVALPLSSGAMHVSASVRRITGRKENQKHKQRVLALEFQWDSTAQNDELDSFIYDSNAEWRFRRLQERIPTPTDFIVAPWDKTRRKKPDRRGKFVSAIAVLNEPERALEVLARLDGNNQTVSNVLTDCPLRKGIILAIFAREVSPKFNYYLVQSVVPDRRSKQPMFVNLLQPALAPDEVDYADWIKEQEIAKVANASRRTEGAKVA